MIILTGCDNTGKSSLALQLASDFNLPIIKSYKPTSQEDITRFHHWAKASPVTPILDRHMAIDDLVYGNVLRGHSSSTTQIAKLCRKGAFLVYCYPGYETVKASFNEREQLKGTHENLTGILHSFKSLMDDLDPDFVFSYKNPHHYPALSQQLTHFLERIK